MMERTRSRFIEDTGEFTGKTMDPDQTVVMVKEEQYSIESLDDSNTHYTGKHTRR